jgi:hypothetical protein
MSAKWCYKFRCENIHGKDKASKTLFVVDKKVRPTIKELDITTPNHLDLSEKLDSLCKGCYNII